MNKDIQSIFENYQETWGMTPQESFKKDKEFFQYVIESNPHLAPLRNIKIKYIFEMYKLKLKQNLDRDLPGLITESKQLNLTLRESFDIIQEFTKSVSDKSAYEGVKEIFESICAEYLLQKGRMLLEAGPIRATASQERIDKKKQGALRHLPPQQYRNVPSSLRGPNKPVDPQSGQGVFRNVPGSMRQPAPAASQRQGIQGHAGPAPSETVSDAEKVTVTLKSGEKVGGVPTGKPAAQGLTQIKLDSGQVAAFPENVIERPGAAPAGATADAEKVTVTLKSGEKVGGVPTGVPAAQGMTQIKLDTGRVFAFPENVIERPGATATVRPDGRGPEPTVAGIKLQDAERQLGTAQSQIKDLEAAASTPRAAEIEQQKQIKDLQAQVEAGKQQYQELEAKEAGQTEDYKQRSDAQQEAIVAQNKQLMAILQAMAGGTGIPGGTSTPGATGPAGPAGPPGDPGTPGDPGKPEPPPVITPPEKPPVKPLKPPKETEEIKAGEVVHPGPPRTKTEKPGILSRAGGWLKDQALPIAGGITGGAIGSMFGPAGTIGGAALGKALGGAATAGIRAPKGSRSKAFWQAPVGKHALQGAAMGLGGELLGAGATTADAAPGPEFAPEVPPGATTTPPEMVGDTADAVSPEYQATMQQQADIGPGGEEVTDTATATEEAPYGVNPNTGEPYPAPNEPVKGGRRLMNIAKGLGKYG